MEKVMRAKVNVIAVEVSEYPGEKLRMVPVCGQFDPNGNSEDNTYARYTPSGSIELFVNNPDLVGKVKPGQKLYVDFTLAE